MGRSEDGSDAQINSIAALGEPIRRELYRYVVAQGVPVSREQAAAGVGVAHHVAKFHLDKLEQDGLLETEYSRPPGRSGPGAGRPSKFYRRAPGDIAVSLPERHYDLAGRVLAQAITTAAESATPLDKALRGAATDTGRALADATQRDSARQSEQGAVDAVIEILTEYGYEPRDAKDGITLANCPFHSLAHDFTDLVCGLNLDLIRGLLRGLDTREVRARLDPGAGRCCVTLARTART